MKNSKNSVLTIRLTNEQHQRVKEVATQRNLTPSKLVREQLTRLK
jgi:predicted transcriptional regulator